MIYTYTNNAISVRIAQKFFEANLFLLKYQRVKTLLKQFIISQFAQVTSASAITLFDT